LNPEKIGEEACLNVNCEGLSKSFTSPGRARNRNGLRRLLHGVPRRRLRPPDNNKKRKSVTEDADNRTVRSDYDP